MSMRSLANILLLLLVAAASLQMGCTAFGAAIGAATGGAEGLRRGARVGAQIDGAVVVAAASSARRRDVRRAPATTYRCEAEKSPPRFYRVAYRMDAISACQDEHDDWCVCERISR